MPGGSKRLRFAPEGYPFMAVLAGLVVLGYLIWGLALAAPFIVLLGLVAFFFRDPERAVPSGPGLYLSAADGKVIYIKQAFFEKDYLRKEAVLISVFMSPLDVHVNRAPCAGRVARVERRKGSFKNAYSEEAFLKNEHVSMLLEEEPGRSVLVRQVAGSIARRAVCRKRPGEALQAGERFGIIKFSSRLDLFLPPDAVPAVKPGDKVLAGVTVMARRGRG